MTENTTAIGGFNQEVTTEFMQTLLSQHAPKFAEFLNGREATEEELAAYVKLAGLSLQVLGKTGFEVSDVLEMFAAYKAEEVVKVEAPTQEVVAEATETPAEEVVAEATETPAEEVVAANENTPCESKCAPNCNNQTSDELVPTQTPQTDLLA
ncbi:MAG: hypothetical protein LW825_06515 [Candidatus Jidaibacter sp.]|jgi:hypothetical protein|nr:hypothetical protein [Candidatus Jidaibacter sp.]